MGQNRTDTQWNWRGIGLGIMRLGHIRRDGSIVGAIGDRRLLLHIFFSWRLMVCCLLLRRRSFPSHVHSGSLHERRCPLQPREVTVQLFSEGRNFRPCLHPLDHSVEGSASASVLLSVGQCHKDRSLTGLFLGR